MRASAGHPPVLRCRPGEFGYLTPTDTGVLLGANPHSTYTELPKDLRPGTTLVLYTDGLIETRTLALDETMAGLLRFVEGLEDLTPKAVCDSILSWRQDLGRRDDDLCILTVRLA